MRHAQDGSDPQQACEDGGTVPPSIERETPSSTRPQTRRTRTSIRAVMWVIASFALMFAMVAPLLRKPTPKLGFHCPGQVSHVARMSARKCTSCHTDPLALAVPTTRIRVPNVGGAVLGDVHSDFKLAGSNNTNCAACHQTQISNRSPISPIRGLR
jgi:hypothetical protein